MAFKAHKEFFDVSAFPGMRRDDDWARKACDRLIAVRRHRYRGVLFSEQRRLLVIGGLIKAFDDYERSGL